MKQMHMSAHLDDKHENIIQFKEREKNKRTKRTTEAPIKVSQLQIPHNHARTPLTLPVEKFRSSPPS